MGLMFARRRQDDKKQRELAKAKAHAENHKKAHAEHKAGEEQPKKVVTDGANKPGAK